MECQKTILGLIAAAFGPLLIVASFGVWRETQSILASTFLLGGGLAFGLFGVFTLLEHTEWFQRVLGCPIRRKESKLQGRRLLSSYESLDPVTPASLVLSSVFALVSGGLFLGFGALFLVNVPASGFSPIGIIIGVGMVLWGGMSFYSFWRYLSQSAQETRVYSDGTVEFVKTFRPTVIHASQIESIRLTGNDRDDNRKMRIEHTAGNITINHFEQVESLLSELSELNPAITVSSGR